MNDFNPQYRTGNTSMDMSRDEGLRAFMLGVYNKLALGIALAGGLAYATGTFEPLFLLVFTTPLLYVVQFGPIALILASAFIMRRPSPLGTALLYWTIVSLLGMGLGVWVAAAAGGIELTSRAGSVMAPEFITIAKAFFVTASAFGALSLYGYTTKRDLGKFGTFLIIGLFGLIALSFVSLLFPPSGMLETGIMLGVLVISGGIIAFETQHLKEGYYNFSGDARSLAVMTNWGALNFFIAFYNMFTIILSLMSRD